MSEKKPKTPDWARRPFEQFLDQGQRLLQVVHLTMSGISSIRGAPSLVRALSKLDEVEGRQGRAADIKRVEKEADLARQEVASGFPLVHAQAVVTLWSYLEALTRSFVTGWLRHAPGALSIKEVAKLKVPLGEYTALSEEDRYSYIFDHLESELRIKFRGGINRFEQHLALFGLSGEVSEEAKRHIFELGHIRNVLVHRGGEADRRLTEACPWLGLSVGETVQITHQQFERYSEAVHEYVTQLIVRVGEHFGVDMSGFKSSGSNS